MDWIIVGVALLLAFYGFGRGFIIGVLSLAGFALGAVLGTRVGTALLSEGSASPYAPAFGLIGAVLVGVVLAAGLEGLGLRLRAALRVPGLAIADGVLGALLSACLVLGVAWIAAAVVVQLPGETDLRRDVRRSFILTRLNELLPPSGPILNALARFDPLPSIAGPSPQIPAPRAGIARAPAVRAAGASVVRIVGTACGLGVEGSGWVAGPHLVVTNAHVVAGESDTAVQVKGQAPGLPAETVAFDAHNDVAVLRVAGLSEPSLALASDPAPGTPAAILGYPHNGPYTVEPGRIAQTHTVVTSDAYGQGSMPRLVTPFRGFVRSGNSGGPLVDARGRVDTTVFAATVGGGPRGGYGVANRVVAAVLAGAHGPVGTGACAH